MKDFIENLEDSAERSYYDMLQSDGKLKCRCGQIFDPDKEGGTVSPSPWAMPVCGGCLDEAVKDMKAGRKATVFDSFDIDEH